MRHQWSGWTVVASIATVLSACGGDSTSPAPGGPVTFASVTTGVGHSCARSTGGAAYCWGSNGSGQLGNGSTTDSNKPVAVSGNLTFASLSAGGTHTCGLTSAGAAYCWGDGPVTGTNTTTRHVVPAAVAGGIVFASLAAGDVTTCGVTSAGVAHCWGLNFSGEIGDGSQTVRPTPVPVSGGITFVSVTVGGTHSCGRTSAGTAYCWGNNNGGALGNGQYGNDTSPFGGIHTPVAVVGGISFAGLSSGRAHELSHTCGVTSAGATHCWGFNSIGQGGDGGVAYTSNTPRAVVGGHAFALVAAGIGHTCGLTTAGAALCWGSNFSGSVGDGTNTDRFSPVAVAGGLAFTDLSTFGHSCGVTGGAIRCWGANDFGQLGDGSRTGRNTPVLVLPP